MEEIKYRLLRKKLISNSYRPIRDKLTYFSKDLINLSSVPTGYLKESAKNLEIKSFLRKMMYVMN